MQCAFYCNCGAISFLIHLGASLYIYILPVYTHRWQEKMITYLVEIILVKES